MTENKYKQPVTLAYAGMVVCFIFGFVGFGMIFFDAPLELMFLLSWIIAIPLLMFMGYKINELQDMAWDMAKHSFEPNVIILVVGAMIGTWIASGTIPFIIYLGLQFISPDFFFITALVLCSLTSLATGTSWGTLGTVGLAIMGVGNILGVPAPLTAGAVISGAYFGDKMSPLSDSTILAASIVDTPVMTHIKHMLYTTVPAYIITAVIFTILGFVNTTGTYDQSFTTEIMATIENTFDLSWITLIPVLFVLVLLVRQTPSIPSLLTGTILGGIIAVVYQHNSIENILDFMMNGFSVETGDDFVNELLNRGGVMSMVSTFLVIFLALCISGMLEKTGIMNALIEPLIKKCGNSTFKIVLVTLVLTYVTNAIGSSMLFASIVTGTLMKNVFANKNLAPENLSRTLEDGGTFGSVLIPWNSNALYASQMLGVSQFAFIPYCFLNWITPIIGLVLAKTGRTMKKIIPDSKNDSTEMTSIKSSI